jgi:hypothetical protein
LERNLAPVSVGTATLDRWLTAGAYPEGVPVNSQPNNALVSDLDFKFVLDSLVTAYRPILERELRLAQSADTLLEDSNVNPPTCDDEIAQAQELFQTFFSPDVALRLLPVEGQQVFGKVDEWDWCYRHIICCLVFGWLVCRGPRTFRGFAYYVYQYWLCVRQSIGEPVSNPPTIAEKRDFSTLVRLLAIAYAPAVKGDLKDLEYPVDIPAEIESGRIDCHVDDQTSSSTFERLLKPDTAAALFGSKSALAAGGNVGNNATLARNCRCYCLSALEFGCCLARSYTLREAVRCLEEFFFRNRACFNPLTAEIDTPPACSSLTFVPACSNLAGIEINGTAAGAAFTNYTLTYTLGGPAINTAVVYPDCSTPSANPSSSTPVSGGILGYLNIDLLPPNTTAVTVYLDVYGSGGLHLQVSAAFQFAINAIAITAVANVAAGLAQDPFNPAPAIIKLVLDTANPGFEKSVGGAVSVTGSAYADGCGSQMTQYQLAAFGPAVGALPLPVPVPSPTALGGTPVIAPVIYDGTPAHPWQSQCVFGAPTPNIILNGDLVASWSTETCVPPLPFVPYTIPQISSNENWSTPASGRYLVYLEVDEAPLMPPGAPQSPAGEDQVAVWIDNYGVAADITAVGNVVGCGDLYLSQYVTTPALVMGVAWDYPIDINSARKAPNDNFGGYSLTYQKNGGTPQPFLASDYTPNGVAAAPTVRVPNLWQATAPNPATQANILASWNIVAALDAGAPADPNNPCVPPAAKPWQLPRGCRCAYVIELYVNDNTWVGDGGNNHNAQKLFAVTVINDIAS